MIYRIGTRWQDHWREEKLYSERAAGFEFAIIFSAINKHFLLNSQRPFTCAYVRNA